MKKILLLITSIILPATIAIAQNTYTINGEIRNGVNGEALIGVMVYASEVPLRGASSNAYGFYSMTLPGGTYTFNYQYLGFDTKKVKVELTKNTRLDIELSEKLVAIDEIVVHGERPDQNVTSTQMSLSKLSIAEIKSIPVLFGEKDILKTIQLLPGIKSAGEGNAGFYVRGGSSDQNLILLDEAPVYNASHVLGFFSIFNSDAIKDVNVYKGGIPAEYGGRLSSVLDVRMKEGNSKEFHGQGGIGLISSHLTLEGPIVKEKGSFMISGRRTYADIFFPLFKNANLNNASLYFYDFNLKANYKLSDNDKLFLSGYYGRDNFGFLQLRNSIASQWGNQTTTLRWNHLFNQKWFMNTSIIYSNFSYSMQIGRDSLSINVISGIDDINLKNEVQYYTGSHQTLKAGVNLIDRNFIPGSVTTNNATLNKSNTAIPKKHALELAIFIEDDISISDKLKANVGIRLSAFRLLGPSTTYSYNTEGLVTDSAIYGTNANVVTYVTPEPRMAITYMLTPSSSVKASYTRTSQYVNLLSNATARANADIWLPGSNNIKPQLCDHYAIGFFKNLADNAYETSVESYYKDFFNQIEYRNGADFSFGKAIEADLTYGKGKAYGVELFLKKKTGKFNGWVSYTLSYTNRVFSELNYGLAFPAKQDRKHEFSIVGIYDITPKLTFSATWVYYTGNAVTFPSGKYMYKGIVVPYYTERNGYRMPAYHRLDLGLTWITRKTDKWESSLNFSVYNAYNRYNAYSISFQPDPNDANKTQVVKLTLFPIIPSISYNFKF